MKLWIKSLILTVWLFLSSLWDKVTGKRPPAPLPTRTVGLPTPIPGAPVTVEPPQISIELIEKRTQHSKTFHLGGNKYACDSSIGSLHYKDIDGAWQDIDTSFTPDGWIDKAPYTLQVNQSGLPGFQITDRAGHEFSIKSASARAKNPNIDIAPGLQNPPVISKNTATWIDVWPGVDIILYAGHDGASLTRIVKSKTAPHEFDVDITETGSGKLVLRDLHPATDALGQEVLMESKLSAKGRTETILTDAKTVYPIVDAVDVSVGASTDDCYARVDLGDFDATFASTVMGNQSGLGFDTGLRFLGINIPQGTLPTITTITFVASQTKTGTTANVSIYGQAADNAITFSTSTEYWNRTKTTASQSYNNIAAWTAGNSYTSPDFSAVVYEVFNRAGWASGNALVVFFNNNSSSLNAIRYGASWDHATYDPPAIHIEYTSGGGNVSNPLPTLYAAGFKTIMLLSGVG